MIELATLREKNIARQGEWVGGDHATLEFRALEVAGETGELCEAIKKYIRSRDGIGGTTNNLADIRDEIGDVLISLDLLCIKLGVDLGQCAAHKFNKTSDKYGLTISIDADSA